MPAPGQRCRRGVLAPKRDGQGVLVPPSPKAGCAWGLGSKPEGGQGVLVPMAWSWGDNGVPAPHGSIMGLTGSPAAWTLGGRGVLAPTAQRVGGTL